MSRLLQVVLAIVGLVLTGVLQHASNRNAEVQNAQGLVELYTQEITAALQTCNLPMLFVAQDTAEELDRLRDRGVLRGDTDFTDHVEEVQRTMPACVAAGEAQGAAPAPTESLATAPAAEAAPVAPELVAQSRNLELRGMERRIEQSVQSARSSATTTARRNFAVLASYAVSDESTFNEQLGAAAHYLQLAAAARAAGLNVQVYRTQISNHFAIVIPADSEEAARDLVAQARRNGWAPDAFVQSEYNWTQCEDPSTIAGLQACAGDAIRRPTRGTVPRSPG